MRDVEPAFAGRARDLKRSPVLRGCVSRSMQHAIYRLCSRFDCGKELTSPGQYPSRSRPRHYHPRGARSSLPGMLLMNFIPALRYCGTAKDRPIAGRSLTRRLRCAGSKGHSAIRDFFVTSSQWRLRHDPTESEPRFSRPLPDTLADRFRQELSGRRVGRLERRFGRSGERRVPDGRRLRIIQNARLGYT